MHIKQILTLACITASLHAVAQTETMHISLSDAINKALVASNTLKLSQARITEATSTRKEATQRRIPDVSISGNYMHILNTDAEVKLKLGQGSNSGSGSGTGTGGGTAESGTTSATPKNILYGMGTVSLPVFTGFKIASAIESAKYLEAASKLDAVKDREDVILNTTAAYINLYKAAEAVRIVEQNLKSAQSRVKEFSNLEQNGLLARNDLLKTQLQQSNIELSLLDAQNSLRVTNINFNLMLGLPEETLLIPDSVFNGESETRNLQEWEMLALQSRSDLHSLDFREKAAYQGIRSAKSDYYPTLAVSAGYIGAYIENVVTVTDALNAGVGIRYSPLSFVRVASNVATAKARLQTVQANKAILTDAVRIQVTQSYENYLLAQKKIDVYAKAVEQAEENYRIINNKYQAQLSTTTDVLDADVAQLQARLNYAFSKADASLAYQKLLQVAGMIGK
jgi:outer membrane protein